MVIVNNELMIYDYYELWVKKIDYYNQRVSDLWLLKTKLLDSLTN